MNRREGLDPPLLYDMSAMDVVPILIAKLKLGSDCGIDLFFFTLKVIFTGQFLLVMYSYQPVLTQRETDFLAYFDCQNSQFKCLTISVV